MYRYKLYVYTIEKKKKNYRRVESTEYHTVSLPVVAYNGSHTDKRKNTPPNDVNNNIDVKSSI